MLEQQMDAEASRVREFERQLKTSAGRRARVASQTAHQDLTRREAVALLEDEIPEVFDAPVFAVEDRQTVSATDAEEHVAAFTSNHGAIIEDAGPQDQDVLRVSPVPLRVAQDGGGFEPVDLSLRATSGGFAPKMPLQTLVIPA